MSSEEENDGLMIYGDWFKMKKVYEICKKMSKNVGRKYTENPTKLA